MGKAEKAYREALQRLINKGADISLDAVAIEAGNGPSAIRRDRMGTLADDIDLAAKLQTKKSVVSSEYNNLQSKKKYKKKYDELCVNYEDALQKIISLENQIWELSVENKQLKEDGVININKKRTVKFSEIKSKQQ